MFFGISVIEAVSYTHLPAAFHPAYVSMALTEAGKAVKPEESARAVAKVFIGVSAGMVLGVPVTSLIAVRTSFTVAMLFFAAINIVVFALTVFFIPVSYTHLDVYKRKEEE